MNAKELADKIRKSLETKATSVDLGESAVSALGRVLAAMQDEEVVAVVPELAKTARAFKAVGSLEDRLVALAEDLLEIDVDVRTGPLSDALNKSLAQVDAALPETVERGVWSAKSATLPDAAYAYAMRGKADEKPRLIAPHHGFSVIDGSEQSSVNKSMLKWAIDHFGLYKFQSDFEREETMRHLSLHASAAGIAVPESWSVVKSHVEKIDLGGMELWDFQEKLDRALREFVESHSIEQAVEVFGTPYEAGEYPRIYTRSIYDGYVITNRCMDDDYLKIEWRKDGDKFVFGPSVVRVKEVTEFVPVDTAEKAVEKSGSIRYVAKAEDDMQRIVLGVVLEPNDGTDGPLNPDTQGDIYSAKDIEQACYRWMLGGHAHKVGHAKPGDGKLATVENYIAPQDLKYGDVVVRKGSWVMGAKVIDDALWKEVVDGKFNAWSIGGTGVRTPADQKEV